jgi:hypothetical protein
MKTVRLNLNDFVTVVLTDLGAQILNRQLRLPQLLPPNWKAGDYYRCQLWFLMNVFAPHIVFVDVIGAREMCFENNELHFEEKT